MSPIYLFNHWHRYSISTLRLFDLMKLIYIFFFSFLLMSCQNKLTYDYLLTHPQYLQSQYERCENVELPECEMIRRAAMDFGALVKHQMQNPDRFGQEIREAQQQLIELKSSYAKNNTPDAKQAVEDQQRKLNGMYAVIALHTPE